MSLSVKSNLRTIITTQNIEKGMDLYVDWLSAQLFSNSATIIEESGVHVLYET